MDLEVKETIRTTTIDGVLYSVEFNITNKSIVDGSLWYTILCSRPIYLWIRSQSREMWHDHKLGLFQTESVDIHEKLYTAMLLRWQ